MIILVVSHISSPRMQLPLATSRARFRPIGRAGAREDSTTALSLPSSTRYALYSCNNL